MIISSRGASRLAVRGLALAFAAVVTACSDSSGPGSRTVSALKIGTGNNQVASAGSALVSPVTFTAVDDQGRAVSGVIVEFTVSAGGGSVAAQRDTSDGSGNVTAQWTVGTTAGQAQSLTAAVVSASSIPPVQASASVVAGAPSALAGGVAGISARAGDAIGAVAVTIRDKYGNAASPSNVRVTVRLENAATTTLAGTLESRTDGSGNAVFTNLSTTGKSGVVTLLFESDGLSSARIPLTLSGGQPAKISTVTSATIDAEALLSGPVVSAKVLDTWDNPVAGVTVSFTISGSAAGSATTGNDGVATLSSWIVPQIGTYQLVASAPGVATGAQFTLNAHAVAAKILSPLATNPSSGTVAHGLVLGVLAIDAIGRPVPNTPLTWTLNGVDHQVTTDGNGVATFTADLPTKSGNTPILVTASPTVSVTMNIQALPGGVVSVVPSKDSIDAPAGTTVSATFTVEDSYGNPIPNTPITASVDPAFATGLGFQAISDASGIVTMTTTLDQYAGYVEFNPGLNSKHTRVYATAAAGSVRVTSAPCVKPVNGGTTTLVEARVFNPNGRLTDNVGVTWTPAAGSGPVSNPFGPVNQQASAVVISQGGGYAPVTWFVTAVIGTYTITAQGPQGYDAPPTVSFSCSVN